MTYIKMSDARKAYILGCASAALGVSNIPTSPLIASFLDTPDFTTLQVIFTDEASFSLSIQAYPENAREVHFIKTVPRALNENEMNSCVVMGTLGNNPLSALLRSLKAVTQPLLQSGNVDSHLQNLASELEAGLSSLLRQGARGDSVDSILLPSDEFDYWASVSNDFRGNQASQDQAKAFMSHFSKISRP